MAEVDPYASGVLDPKVHGKLVAGIDRWAALAGIPKRMIWTRATGVCSAEEIAWVRDFKLHQANGRAGLCYVGDFDPPVEDRMMLIAGGLLRNYIDARFAPLQDVLQELQDGTRPASTALLLPNFFLGAKEGGKLPQWRISELQGLLLSRLSQSKLTLLYVSDMKGLELEYGKPIARHIQAHYDLIEA